MFASDCNFYEGIDSKSMVDLYMTLIYMTAKVWVFFVSKWHTE